VYGVAARRCSTPLPRRANAVEYLADVANRHDTATYSAQPTLMTTDDHCWHAYLVEHAAIGDGKPPPM